jgi:four helix bundle suffix protein
MNEPQQTPIVKNPDDGVLLPHGGYRKLRSYKVAEAVYDATVVFCRRFVSQDRRMTDLLKRQVESQGATFLKEGGFTERLHAARSRARASDRSDKSDQSDAPLCPLCGKPMLQRTARKGPHAGQTFWGCSAFPECRGVRPT